MHANIGQPPTGSGTASTYFLNALAASGARPAGPPPLPPASGAVIVVERRVNASGNVSLGDHIVSAGLPLAGQRVTLRLDGPGAHVLFQRRPGLRRRLPRPARGPVPAARSRRRNSPAAPAPRPAHGDTAGAGARAIMTGGQRIQAGLPHAGKTAEVTVESGTCQVTVEPGITIAAPCTAGSMQRGRYNVRPWAGTHPMSCLQAPAARSSRRCAPCLTSKR